MKINLAENMLRFGVKNLNESSISKVKTLAEQGVDDPADKLDPAEDEMSDIDSSKQTGKFDKSVKDDQVNVNIKDGTSKLDDPSQAYITKDPAGKARIEKNKSFNRYALLTKAAAANPASDAIEADMVKSYGETYYNLIRNFSSNIQGGESQSLWFRRFPQAIRNEFLKQFPSMISGLKSYTVQIHRGLNKYETKTIEPSAGVDPMLPSILFKGNNVFANNKSAITPGMQAEINKFINKIKQAIEFNNASGQKMKYILSDFNIAASANRFRNMQEAANMTWAELSTARGQNVKTELLKQLQQLGIDVSKAVNAPILLGYNGDGTSGPNPPSNYNITSDGKTIIPKPSEEELNKFGKPLTGEAAYEQYKFVVVTAQIDQIPDDEPIPQTKETKILNFYLKVFPQSDKVVQLKGKLAPLMNTLFPPSKAFDQIRFMKSKYTK
jgi:hypothetical protein